MSDVHQMQSTEFDINNSRNKNKSCVKQCAYKKLRLLFSTPGLIILVVFYSIMGAFLFPLLEAPKEIQKTVSISKSREECLKELWTITERLNVLYERNWTLLVHEQLRRFEGSIVVATKGSLKDAMNDHFPSWSFSEALLYSITVITTIGHGNLSPRTSEGKIVTMVYAIVGVPLMLMCLSSLGGLLADALQCTYGKLCGLRKVKYEESTQDNFCQQFEEVDYNFCKYDAVAKDIKHNKYDKYSTVCEDSCHLICNSPNKSINEQTNTSTSINPGQSIVGRPLLKHSLHHNIENLKTGKTYIQTVHHEHQNNKYGIHLQNNMSNNDRDNLVVYHKATVHGIGPSKFIPKPLPQEINMLISESDLDCQQSTSLSVLSKNKCAKIECPDDNNDDDDEDKRIGCQHNTPSRIPLITTTSKCTDYYSDSNDEDCNEDNNSIANYSPQVPITIILIILTSYICLGTILFSIWENWSIIDGAYFCFVTLSTIGFGDLVPKKTFRGPELQLFACCVYLMLGLVLVAMSFSLLETQLLWKCRRMAVRLKLAKD